MSYSCTNIGALNVNVTLGLGAIVPANGYRVKWRPIGTTEWNYVTQNQNPVVISNVPLCDDIEGTVQSNCGDGNFGMEFTFFVSAVSVPCKQYRLTSPLTMYTYTACGAKVPTSFYNPAFNDQGTVICAQEGSVGGGAFTNLLSACTG